MKILIAEDEEDIAEAYRIALENRGHEVTITKDGAQCIVYYTALCNAITPLADLHGHTTHMLDPPFDVAILDYRMPQKNGLDVAKEILELRPKQRIIFASAYVRETLMDSVTHSNMVVELLQKPFGLDVLVDTVEGAVTKKELNNLNVT